MWGDGGLSVVSRGWREWYILHHNMRHEHDTPYDAMQDEYYVSYDEVRSGGLHFGQRCLEALQADQQIGIQFLALMDIPKSLENTIRCKHHTLDHSQVLCCQLTT